MTKELTHLLLSRAGYLHTHGFLDEETLMYRAAGALDGLERLTAELTEKLWAANARAEAAEAELGRLRVALGLPEGGL